jgi:hypothetical protein
MKDLGVARYCLGLEIPQNLKAQTVRISQKKYFQGVVERFGMADCKAASTPFPVGMKLTSEMGPKTAEARQIMASKDYLGLLGCLMYGMLGTRPDLAFAVRVGSRFSSKPGNPALERSDASAAIDQRYTRFGDHVSRIGPFSNSHIPDLTLLHGCGLGW